MDSAQADRLGSGIAIRTAVLLAAVYVAWVAVWLLKGLLDSHTAWTSTQGGGFAYWTAMKILLWILPSMLLIRLSGQSLRDVLGLSYWRRAVLWGGATGLLLGLFSVLVKVVMHRPILSVSPGWPFISVISVILIAPVFEEFMFRGAVLGALAQRYRFAVANVVTAALFLGMHLPGWYFQGHLRQNLASPVSGALAIFLLGLVFGLVAHKGKSLVASVLAHCLNNLLA